MRLLLWVWAACLYDVLILAALSMLLAATYTFIAGIAFHEHMLTRLLFQINWLMLISGYYVISWRRGGQTIGMRAWQLTVRRTDGQSMTWPDSWRRLAAALTNLLLLNLGWLGYLGTSQQSLTDHLSATRIERMAKNG